MKTKIFTVPTDIHPPTVCISTIHLPVGTLTDKSTQTDCNRQQSNRCLLRSDPDKLIRTVPPSVTHFHFGSLMDCCSALLAVLLTVGLACGRPLVTSGDSSDQVKDIVEYLVKYGYLQETNSITHDYLRDGLRRFAEDAGYVATEELVGDVEEMRKLMRRPRCKKAFDDSVTLQRNRRFVANKKKWLYTDLTWQLSDPHGLFKNTTDYNVVRAVLTHAFGMWSLGSNDVLQIKDVSNGKHKIASDIDIHFALGAHGDHEAFDGPGGIVAHSGYPMEGKIHFDGAELWTVGGRRGIDFRYVALHEIGHALGLRHSQFNDSIMYPIYIRDSQEFGLSADDVAGVQYLYNAPLPRLNVLSSFNVTGLEEKSAKVHRKLQKHIKAGRKRKPKQTEETVEPS